MRLANYSAPKLTAAIAARTPQRLRPPPRSGRGGIHEGLHAVVIVTEGGNHGVGRGDRNADSGGESPVDSSRMRSPNAGATPPDRPA